MSLSYSPASCFIRCGREPTKQGATSGFGMVRACAYLFNGMSHLGQTAN